eukprot:gene11457-23962_t
MGDINEISNIIRLKERELHEIHEIRCSQLENLVKERDSLLTESTNRFEQLKDDFRYNLALLEARDEEIVRLEKLSVETNKQLLAKDNENKQLIMQLEQTQALEENRRHKLNQEHNNHKQILQEFNQEIESIRWATAEEMKSKNRDIEILHEDIRQLISTREESLDSQRKDLTHTFEQLLHNRELSFSEREKEINHSVLILEERFEMLQTENSRLHSELLELQRNITMKTEELGEKEEQLRQVQWRLEDERQNSQLTEDTLQRQLQQLQSDNMSLKDHVILEKTEFEQTLKRTTSELHRERDYRQSLDGRIEELRQSLQQEQNRQQKQLHESLSRDETLLQEISSLQSERDSLLLRVSASRSDSDDLTRKLTDSTRVCDELRLELQTTRDRLRTQTEHCSSLEVEIQKAHVESESLSRVIQQKEAKAVALAQEAAESLKSLQDMEETLQRAMNKMEHAAKEQETISQETVKELRNALETEKTLKNDALSQCSSLQSQLRNEKAEGAALRLRLQLQENKLVQSSRPNDNNVPSSKKATAMATMMGAVPAPQEPERELQSPGFLYNINDGTGGGMDGGGAQRAFTSFGHSSTDRSLDDVHLHQMGMQMQGGRGGISSGGAAAHKGFLDSPMFSEDLGPASLPPSPLSRQRPPSSVGKETYRERERDVGRARVDAPPSSFDDVKPLWAMEQENEQLKAVIREMRGDVELLREQVHKKELATTTGSNLQSTVSEESSSANNTATTAHLQQALQEISRLRQERSKLMDTSNELRAHLRR